MSAALLAVAGVSKSFGATTALRGVSFTVNEGEIFGLLGPNGAGKTTLLSIISGLLEADQGTTELAGVTLGRRQRALRRQIGIVPQELALYAELTAAENLRFFGELYGLRGAELEQRVQQILAAVGLAERTGDRVGTFSGGMQRRLNLGAGLIHSPRLLLLDEPTAGVDPQSRNLLFEEIRRLHREGMTIVYTSHYMEEVQALCPRIGIIDHGRLIACDTLADLLGRLPGRIVARVAGDAGPLPERLAALPGVERIDRNGPLWDITCADVPGTALHLLDLARAHHVTVEVLDMERPNLERVFLHLTGRELRD